MTPEEDRARILERCMLARGREGIVETLRPFADTNEEVREALAWYEARLGDTRLVRN